VRPTSARRILALLALLVIAAPTTATAAATRPTPIVVGLPPGPLGGIVIALDPGHNGDHRCGCGQTRAATFEATE